MMFHYSLHFYVNYLISTTPYFFVLPICTLTAPNIHFPPHLICTAQSRRTQFALKIMKNDFKSNFKLLYTCDSQKCSRKYEWYFLEALYLLLGILGNFDANTIER